MVGEPHARRAPGRTSRHRDALGIEVPFLGLGPQKLDGPGGVMNGSGQKFGAGQAIVDGRIAVTLLELAGSHGFVFFSSQPSSAMDMDEEGSGFLGINLHYLPIPLRIRLLDRLVDFSNDTDFDETTRLIVEYRKVKNIKLVKPTIHKYLAGQVKSQFRRIDADEFTIATLLPVQRFKKATAKEVWSDSRSMV